VPILEALQKAGCEIRATATVRAFPAKPATEADWTTEYLDAIISVKLVDGVSEAIEHINAFLAPHRGDHRRGSGGRWRFFNEIDSAILLHNASTQFADGGEFGMGGEIGIATGKMHARGPVGVEQLTSFKYRVRGPRACRSGYSAGRSTRRTPDMRWWRRSPCAGWRSTSSGGSSHRATR
jgi:glutamate-5-semialdehyde dehydrogenase